MVVLLDYYETLGVAREATQDEICKAYRARAMRWHPDKWCAEPEADRRAARVRFEQVQEAYEQLRDSDKRSSFDKTLANKSIERPMQSPQGSATGQSPSDSYAAEVARELKEALENAASAKTPNRRRYWMNKAESWERTLDPIISMITQSEAAPSEPTRPTHVEKRSRAHFVVILAILIVIAVVATALGLTGPTSAH